MTDNAVHATGRQGALFELLSWRVITEDGPDTSGCAEATVKLQARGKRAMATAEGNGPVNALEHALRRALQPAYPEVSRFELVDYDVRIVEGSGGGGTAAKTGVRAGFSDGRRVWQAEGASHDLLAASCDALKQALTYGLLSTRRGAGGLDAAVLPDVSALPPAPLAQQATCTLTVTLRDSRAALGRIAATLRSVPVMALTYAGSEAAWAVVEVQVPGAEAARACARLRRMVDVLTVTSSGSG
ncbi:alpha-isopropylmalate synthase regulatory domain-containing protein [Streptomyces sp. NBC_01304]|uniref:alpha-isopropylmalate synthase regulatory domain-containing protein n=1 Tax=Streptomyces sp. NBC_01304 TaxID=2903818 RepID=UPI002E136F5B|nr:hypothetical protein OG430_43700 [Streptomyces sp. NBC_01304]